MSELAVTVLVPLLKLAVVSGYQKATGSLLMPEPAALLDQMDFAAVRLEQLSAAHRGRVLQRQACSVCQTLGQMLVSLLRHQRGCSELRLVEIAVDRKDSAAGLWKPPVRKEKLHSVWAVGRKVTD